MKTRKRKIWSVVLIGLLVVTCYVLCEGNTKPLGNRASVQTQLQAAETQTSEQTGPDESAAIPDSLKEEYDKWIWRAECSADGGHILFVKAKLTMARWCVEDANIPEEARVVMLKDFSEKTEVITLKVYSEAASYKLVDALYYAYGCREASMRNSLERFKFYSLKAGMEPDGKVKRTEEILAKSLIEREKLSKN